MQFYLKLRAWFIVLFAVVLAMGLTAITGLFRTHLAVDSILGEQYQNIERGQQMVQLLEAYEYQLLHNLLAERSSEQMATAVDNVSAVRPVLIQIQQNVAATPIEPTVRKIEQQLAAFQQAAADLQQESDLSAQELRLYYRDTLIPAALRLRESIREFIVQSQQSVDASGQQARKQSQAWSYAVTAVTLLGLLVMLVFNHQVTKGVILPIRKLARFIDRVNLGDTHFRIPTQYEEDLKELAATSNRLIESFESVTEESRRQIQIHEKRSLVLIESYHQPVLLVDAAAEVVLANSAARLLFTGPDGNRALNELKTKIKAGEQLLDIGRQPYKIQSIETTAVQGFTGHVVLLAPAEKTEQGSAKTNSEH